MEVSVAFGRALRKLRLEKGFTQEHLGFEAGLRRTFISSLERGEKSPSLETIAKLSTVFEMPISEFMLQLEAELRA